MATEMEVHCQYSKVTTNAGIIFLCLEFIYIVSEALFLINPQRACARGLQYSRHFVSLFSDFGEGARFQG